MNTDTQQNSGSAVRTLDLTRFRDAVGIIVQCKCQFGNTRNAKKEKVTLNITATGNAEQDQADETKAKARLTLKKQLIQSPQYDAIKSFQNEIRTWLYGQTVPSFFKEGFALASLASVPIIENRLKRAAGFVAVGPDEVTLPKLVKAFQDAYPAQVEEARSVLEPAGQFDPLNYPAASELAGMFRIEWAWVSFSVPDGLPAELRQVEQDKMQKRMTDAADQITDALRCAFSELITHATDKLKPSDDGKPKIFRDSLIGNLAEFIETFNRRDLTNDVALAQLVAQAKTVLTGTTPEKLRRMDNVREETLKQFDTIKTKLDKLIITKPSRAVDLSDEA